MSKRTRWLLVITLGIMVHQFLAIYTVAKLSLFYNLPSYTIGLPPFGQVNFHTADALDGGDSAAFSSIFPWPVGHLRQAGFEFFLLPNIVHAWLSSLSRHAPAPCSANANRGLPLPKLST